MQDNPDSAARYQHTDLRTAYEHEYLSASQFLPARDQLANTVHVSKFP